MSTATLTRSRSSRSAEIANECLMRAQSGMSMANYPAIYEGFAAKGIPLDEIRPRENVFTFNAWRAKGRTVRKGEHGVKVTSWVPIEKTDPKTGKIDRSSFCRTVTVFHESQTDEIAS